MSECGRCRVATIFSVMALGMSIMALVYASWFIPMLTNTVERLTKLIEGGEYENAQRIERSVTETPKRDH